MGAVANAGGVGGEPSEFRATTSQNKIALGRRQVAFEQNGEFGARVLAGRNFDDGVGADVLVVNLAKARRRAVAEELEFPDRDEARIDLVLAVQEVGDGIALGGAKTAFLAVEFGECLIEEIVFPGAAGHFPAIELAADNDCG